MQTETALDEMMHRAIEGFLTAFGNCADRGDDNQIAELFLNAGMLIMGAQQIHGRVAYVADVCR